jgi:sulfur-oxidizing protein SoxZ
MSTARIRIPTTAKVGDVIEIKTLISHVMETGQRRDQSGKPIPRNIIHTFTAAFEGKEVFKAELQPGISANPYIAFFLKVPGSGELTMTWEDDNGGKVVEKSRIQAT